LCASGVPHIVEKILTRAITLLLISLQSEVFTRRYGPPKLQESQFREFQNSQFGNPRTKWHLGVGHVAKHIKYYKGEGDGFPQVWAMVNLVNSCLPMSRLCTKRLRTMECTPTPYPFIVFTFGLLVKFIKEFRGASLMMTSTT
jgi:hypothetical protein